MQVNRYTKGLVLTFLFLSQATIVAAECRAKSDEKTIPLLALYTSEGCSSCPPADQWMSAIQQPKNTLSLLEFHVDYWDYIGWKDPFSRAEYSDRQRQIATFGGAGFVYTPQFVLNGRDFKGWNNRRLNSAINTTQQLPSRANLSLDVATETDGSMTLKASAEVVRPADGKKADVFVALYENGLVSHVQAGENIGRQLKHDYVVRQLFGAYPMKDLNPFNKSFTLNPSWKNKVAGAVIFLQDRANGEIIQSLTLDFCHE